MTTRWTIGIDWDRDGEFSGDVRARQFGNFDQITDTFDVIPGIRDNICVAVNSGPCTRRLDFTLAAA